MKSFIINFHSIVDVITNSSTTIFTWVSAGRNHIKEVINAILLAGGSDKKFDDLFVLEIFPDFTTIFDYIVDELEEEENDEKLENTIIYNFLKKENLTYSDFAYGKDYEPNRNKFIEYYKTLSQHEKERIIDLTRDEDYYCSNTYLSILPLSKEGEDLGARIQQFFSSDGYYNS